MTHISDMTSQWISWITWFLAGAAIGSFLNVCIYRLPREQSVINPSRSYCPHCKHLIAWFNDIPLVSYLVLRARCRHCHKPIHWRYPVVEAASGLLTVAVLQRFSDTPVVGFIYLIFVWGLLVSSFIDLEHQIIPDEISLGGLVVGLLASTAYPPLHGMSSPWQSLWYSAMGAVAGGGSIYLIGLLGNFIFRRESMGGGDVKLLAMVGSILGWKLTLLAFFIAPFFGSVVGIILKVREGAEIIPYGPFLSLGSIVALLWGDRILVYLGFIR